MPAVVSKFLADAVDAYERRGKNVEVISKTILSTAVLAYVVKISYPHIKRKISSQKKSANGNCVNHNNNNITKPSVKAKNEAETIAEIKEGKLKLLEKKLKQPGLNLEFILQLKKLIEIMIPRLICHETGLLSVHTLCLISRTFLSIYVAAMEGAIVKYIVRKDVKNFAWMIFKWFSIAIPATFINSMIRYLENKLALAFR
jgi:ATP-binding cassette, subfamily D (ALD), member 2